MNAEVRVFNVFISAVRHKINETDFLLIYLRCDTNSTASNPTLSFSSNYLPLYLSLDFEAGVKG